MNGRNLEAVKRHAHALKPVLDQETFVVTHIDDLPDGFHKALHIANRDEVILHDGKERVDYDSSAGLQWRIRWRWAPGAREQLKSFVDQQETLPKCGCRLHVPDSRGAPDGVLFCKFCGTEYSKERIKELTSNM
jgi:hypothetical protein